MKHIAKIIENELKHMSDEDRGIFRKASLKTFEILINDLEKKMNNFEEKILDSAVSDKENINIVSMIVPKEEFYLYEEEFSPIILSDMQEKSLIDILESNEKIYKKIIIEDERNNLKIFENMKIQGKIKIKENIYNIDFILEKDESYVKRIKDIYDVFGLNSLKWRTINIPYINKIFKLKILNFNENLVDELKKESDNLKIEFEEDNNRRKWLEDYIIIWNIQKINMLGNGEIKPTVDRIHYEHTLYFNNNRNIYLCPNKEVYIYYIQKTATGFRVITDENKEMNWEFLSFNNVDEKIYEKKLKNPVFSNKINMSFINKIKLENDVRLRTIGEIKRIANSFNNVNQRLNLERVEITKEDKPYIKNSDLNFFKIDEFKLKGDNSNIYFYFSILKKDSYIEDILEFIISELQLYFPEYKCKGVFL